MSSNSIVLPSAEQFICQIGRLVKIQELAGMDARPLYSQRIDDVVFSGDCLIPGFGQLSIMKSIDSLEHAIVSCTVFGDPKDEAQYFTVSRLPDETSWTLHGDGGEAARIHIKRLTSFVCESPKEVFERLFDLWFYDYPGIIPDDFTLEQIESLYDQS